MSISRFDFQTAVLDLEELKARELIRRFPDPSINSRPKVYQPRGNRKLFHAGAAEAALELIVQARAELAATGHLSESTIEALEVRMQARTMLIVAWERLSARKGIRNQPSISSDSCAPAETLRAAKTKRSAITA